MPATPRSVEHILVPVDGSEGALAAAAFAGVLARATGARITLFHVARLTTAELLGMANQSREQIEHDLRQLGDGHLRVARNEVGEGVELIEAVDMGDPATEICARAARDGVDLVVMGSRGQTPLRELLLGSVSDQVVRRAPCPVTVVR